MAELPVGLAGSRRGPESRRDQWDNTTRRDGRVPPAVKLSTGASRRACPETGQPPHDKVRELQTKRSLAAKGSPSRRFHALYDRIYRMDVLERAVPEDIREVFEVAPEVLVIGQERFGCKAVPAETLTRLQAAGIEVLARRIDEACESYNRLREERKGVAALRLTC